VKTFLKKYWLLAIIIFLSLILRVYKIADNPPSLNWDEVSHGFNAYSILKTGRDEWGVKLPLIFRCFGDFKLPLYIYLTVLPVALFGLNPFSVRFVSILSGVGLAIVGYFLGKKLTKKESGGWLTALLVAISPWSLFLSRVAVEANLGAFLLSLGGYFWLVWQEKKGNRKNLILAVLFWGLSLYAYNSTRVLVPLLFLATLISALKKKRLKRVVFPAFLLALFFIPVVFQFLNKSGGARFFWVSPVDQGAINRIIEKRVSSQLPAFVSRLFYNRPSYFLGYSFRNYLKHFSPSFWFFSGGDHYQFSLPGLGLIYIVAAPFLLLGLFFTVFSPRRCANAHLRGALIAWFLLSLAPSAITRDSPHVLRSILILPLPMVFISLGAIEITSFLKSRSRFGGKLLFTTFSFMLLVNLAFWWRNYWQIYRPNYSWAWQFGQQRAVEYVKEHYGDYDRIVFTKKYGEPHEFILFYWPWEPADYQYDQSKVWDYHANWYWIDGFDKFQFWNDWEVESKLKVKNEKLKLLLVTSPGNWVEGGELVKEVNFLNGEPAFEIISYD